MITTLLEAGEADRICCVYRVVGGAGGVGVIGSDKIHGVTAVVTASATVSEMQLLHRSYR